MMESIESSFLQKVNLSAAWIWRAVLEVDVIVPAPPELITAAGTWNCGWLNMLKNSTRNNRADPSVIGKCFSSEESTLTSLGPRSVFRPTFPQLYGVGEVNAAGLNHWVVPPRITGPVKPGFQFGRTGFRESPSLDGLKLNCGVKGNPDWIVTMLFKVHPPMMPFSQAFALLNSCLPFPMGRS